MENKTKIKAILIDLSGTIHVDDDPTPNAIEALQKYDERFHCNGSSKQNCWFFFSLSIFLGFVQ